MKVDQNVNLIHRFQTQLMEPWLGEPFVCRPLIEHIPFEAISSPAFGLVCIAGQLNHDDKFQDRRIDGLKDCVVCGTDNFTPALSREA